MVLLFKCSVSALFISIESGAIWAHQMHRNLRKEKKNNQKQKSFSHLHTHKKTAVTEISENFYWIWAYAQTMFQSNEKKIRISFGPSFFCNLSMIIQLSMNDSIIAAFRLPISGIDSVTHEHSTNSKTMITKLLYLIAFQIRFNDLITKPKVDDSSKEITRRDFYWKFHSNCANEFVCVNECESWGIFLCVVYFEYLKIVSCVWFKFSKFTHDRAINLSSVCLSLIIRLNFCLHEKCSSTV